MRDSPNDLWDAWDRQQSPTMLRWLSPDPGVPSAQRRALGWEPAGLAAVDPNNPQTWNRYAYVSNQPLEFTDPTGELGQEFCPWCAALGPLGIAIDIGSTIADLFGLFGASPAPPPHPAHTVVNANPGGGPGEVVGGGSTFPGGTTVEMSVNPSDPLGLGLLLGIPDTSCDFGACGSGAVNGFIPGAGVLAGTALCEIAEPCGAFEDALLLGAAAAELGIAGAQIYQARKRDLKVVDEAMRQIQKICGKQLSLDQRERLHD